MRRLIALAAVLALGVGAIAAAVRAASRPYEVTANVISAAQVVPGNDVTLGGVPVGRVAAVGLTPDGAAITLQIDGRYAPLRRGTRVNLRPRGLLGTMYIELTAAAGPPIPSGGSIPVQDTAAPVTLDEVTDVLDPEVRQALQTLAQQGGVALAGRGTDVNQILQKLPTTAADLASAAGALDTRQRELDALTVEFDRVAAMVAGEDTALRGDLRDGAALLDTLAAHQQALQQELIYANASLAQLNAGLNGREAQLNQLLQEQPALLSALQSLEANSTTTFATVDPCVQDLYATLAEMSSATSYRHPAGSTDGNGFMLRVDPQLVGASTGSFSPVARCSGGTP